MAMAALDGGGAVVPYAARPSSLLGAATGAAGVIIANYVEPLLRRWTGVGWGGSNNNQQVTIHVHDNGAVRKRGGSE